MKKRVSKRRWKARIRLGKWIPETAIHEHRLRNFAALWERDIYTERSRSVPVWFDEASRITPEQIKALGNLGYCSRWS